MTIGYDEWGKSIGSTERFLCLYYHLSCLQFAHDLTTSGTSQLEWAPSGALCGLGAQRDTDRGVGPRRRAGRLRLHRVVRRSRGCTLTRDLVTIRGH